MEFRSGECREMLSRMSHSVSEKDPGGQLRQQSREELSFTRAIYCNTLKELERGCCQAVLELNPTCYLDNLEQGSVSPF